MKNSGYLLLALIVLTPVVYLLVVYPQLPETVPTHFDMDGKANGWSSKSNFLLIIIGLSLIGFLCNFFLPKAYLVDPKKNAIENKSRLQRIGIAIALFIAAIEIFIVHTVRTEGSKSDPRVIFVAVGVLLAVIGNYLDNIKPNYFAGLRLPWTLESEDNWRRTHHFASRIWFAGGFLIALCSLVLPNSISVIVLVVTTLTMVLIPAIYSYQLYRKNKQNFSS